MRLCVRAVPWLVLRSVVAAVLLAAGILGPDMAVRAQAAPADLDLTFGAGGRVTTSVSRRISLGASSIAAAAGDTLGMVNSLTTPTSSVPTRCRRDPSGS